MDGAPQVSGITLPLTAHDAASPLTHPGVTPRAGLPAKPTLDYIKVAVEVMLLLLAVPWLLKQLFSHPGKVSKRAAAHHLGGG